jgi:hypothetical protein
MQMITINGLEIYSIKDGMVNYAYADGMSTLLPLYQSIAWFKAQGVDIVTQKELIEILGLDLDEDFDENFWIGDSNVLIQVCAGKWARFNDDYWIFMTDPEWNEENLVVVSGPAW